MNPNKRDIRRQKMNVKCVLLTVLTLALPGFLTLSYGQEASKNPDTSDKEETYLTDRTGRRWDITHAVTVYGMSPDYFNFGIGLGKIPSVDHPKIEDKTDPAFPSAEGEAAVIGVDYNGEQRAYAVEDMIRHEVFNENYPGDSGGNVSVAY